MNQDRDMFYSGYSYGMVPMNQNMMPNSNIPNNNNYMNNWYQDINNRINRLERQTQRLETRITRLETPYQNNTTNNYITNNEPDSNMYMM